MPVSAIHRTNNRMSHSRSRDSCEEVTITPTDTVIGRDAETGTEKRIDLSALNPNVPVAKALVGKHLIGKAIPIRGARNTWEFVLTRVVSS